MRYKTKPCEIDAVQWTGDNLSEIMCFCHGYSQFDSNLKNNKLKRTLTIKTLEGDMIASLNDYIIRGLRGEYYPCKPDVFNKKYELISEYEE